MEDNEPYLHLWYQDSKRQVCSLNTIFKIYYYAFFILNTTFGLSICLRHVKSNDIQYNLII